MNKTRLTEEVFKMRFEEILGRYQQRRLTCEEASELLGVSVSTFFRKRQRYDADNFDGHFDRRLGRISPHRAADKEVEKITRLYNERYLGFSVQHFYEFAQREHGLSRSYNWTRQTLLAKGIIKKSTRGGKHRRRRERRPMEGMMLHQDGSTHRWLINLEGALDLIVTLDDATSKITSAFLVDEEGTLSTFQGLEETIRVYGLFCSFYTDRGSHYFYTPNAGKKVDKQQLTQVGRALKQLGIEHIAAYSPQARGRSERLFGTLQARLPKEFALHQITTIEAANAYLKEIYIPRHNQQFGVKAKCEDKAYVPWCAQQSLKNYLCIQEKRMVQRDNTIRYKGLILQIPKNNFRHQYVKARVCVHEYADRQLAIFYGPLCIGRYDFEGNLLRDKKTRTKQAVNY